MFFKQINQALPITNYLILLIKINTIAHYQVYNGKHLYKILVRHSTCLRSLLENLRVIS